jgi:hypothetical protein
MKTVEVKEFNMLQINILHKSYIRLLCFWTLDIVLFLHKTYDISETELCLRLQTEPTQLGPHGSVVGWGTLLQAGRSPVRVPDEVDFFNLTNPSSRTMALGSTQPLTEMRTRNLPGGKKRPARGSDNLAAICEPIV